MTRRRRNAKRSIQRYTALTAIALVICACGGAAGPSAPVGSPAPNGLPSARPAPTASPAPTVTAAPLPHGVIAFVPTPGGGPIELAASDSAIWVENHRTENLSQIDPEQNVEIARFPNVQAHCDIATGAGFVWVTRAATSIVSKVDPASGNKVDTVGLRDACGVDADDEDVWVASPGLGKVVRSEAATLDERASVAVGPNPFWVAIGPEAVWVAGEADGGTLYRINSATNKVVASISVPNPFATGVAVGHGAVWVPARDRHVIYRIDPATNSVAVTIQLPTLIGGIGVGSDAIWSSGFGDGKVYRIDPATNAITGSIDTGLGNLGPPIEAFGSIWVAALDRNVVARIDPAAVE
jgi:DNA-binding beta-propeller fold protein YncE